MMVTITIRLVKRKVCIKKEEKKLSVYPAVVLPLKAISHRYAVHTAGAPT